jgi:transcriptional regulator with XRE-family HTH domain
MAGNNMKKQLDQALIARVIKAREAAGMTQQEVSDGMGVPQDHYKHWELKRVMPHYLIPRFCIVVRVEDGWLISGRGQMKRSEATIGRLRTNSP